MALYTPDEIRQVYEEYQRRRALNLPITKEFENRVRDASVGIKDYSRQLESSLGQLKSASLGLVQSFNDGKSGASVYNDTLRTGADLIAAFLKALGPLGWILGGLVKAGVEYVAAANEQSDALFDGYTKLNQLGVGLSGGVDDVYKIGQQLGYSTKQLGELATLLAKDTKTYAMLGGTTERGVKQFAGVVDGMRGYETEFRKLGLSIDDVNEGTAGYMRMQAQTGRGQLQDTASLSRGAAEYIKQQQLVSKLTGQNAEAQQSVEQEMVNNNNFQIAQRELRKREQEALARGDVAEAARLKKQYDENIKLIKLMPADLRKGAMDSMTGYIGASKEAEQFARLAPEAAKRIRSGSFEATDTLDTASKEAGVNMNRFGNTLGKLGKQDELFGAYAGARDLELMTLKDSVKNREEQAKKEQEEQKNLKGATESYANMLVDQRRTREAAENFINAGINPVSSAMSKLTDVANKISGGAVGAAKGVGVGVSTPGTPTSGAPVAPPARTATTSQVERLVRDQLSTMGITSPRAVANIMAQIQAESGFKPQSENLNYSGRTLFEMFGAGNRYKNKERFANIDEANAVAARGPEAVGNILYGGRMGNALDEGFKYRGRGLIQLTGKDNYRKYSKLVGVDLVSNPDEANELGTAAKIAATYFVQAKKGGTDLENIKSVGKAVGYAGGEKETQKRAELAEGYMKGYKFGGIAKGPESGFETTLHGTEAVIPLPNGKTIPIDMPGMATSMRDQLAMISAQTSRLDDLISVMKKRNQISQKILQASKS